MNSGVSEGVAIVCSLKRSKRGIVMTIEKHTQQKNRTSLVPPQWHLARCEGLTARHPMQSNLKNKVSKERKKYAEYKQSAKHFSR
jgi:hypothetical protein